MKFDPKIQPGPYMPIGCDMRDLYPRSMMVGVRAGKTVVDRAIQCPQPITGRTATSGGTSITINIRR